MEARSLHPSRVLKRTLGVQSLPGMSFIYSSDAVYATKQTSQLKQEFHTPASNTTLLARNDQKIQCLWLIPTNAKKERLKK